MAIRKSVLKSLKIKQSLKIVNVIQHVQTVKFANAKVIRRNVLLLKNQQNLSANPHVQKVKNASVKVINANVLTQ